MTRSMLELAVADVVSMKAIFITAMPDCLLYQAWQREESDLDVSDVASYFGDLVRSNREGLRALGSWSSDMTVTIESADALVILKELGPHFVCGSIFERGTPLGMVRLHLKRVLERISNQLPSIEAEERPRGVRLVEFVRRYAPDPHSALLRISVRTGLTIEQLEAAENLGESEVERLEGAARRILGLNQITV